MLRIKELYVSNFRSIYNQVFDLPSLTVLVGKNDVGKSNLIETIRLLFEGTAASVDAVDFYDVGSPIEIRAVLEGARQYLDLCDDRTRPKVELRLDGSGQLTIRRLAQAPKELGEIEVLDPSTGEFGRPTGIDAALKPMLPKLIYIGALADVADETKGTQKDALGMLVNEVMASIVSKIEPKLREAYKAADSLLNFQPSGTGAADERPTDLTDIESEITSYLKDTFPNASVRLKVELASIKEILERVHVFVREGRNEDPYYRRGHGMQRTLYLSLLRTLASRIRRGQNQAVFRPFILLFEEPEAFLHPDGQIKMRTALSVIANEAQVIIATHSPLMVSQDNLSKTVRLEKCVPVGSEKPTTRRFGPIDPENLTEVHRKLVPLFSIQRSSRFLFSRGVLLVEGVGDDHLFSAIAERLRQFRLEESDIAIVEAGGKANLAPFAEILSMLGLAVWVLTDLDFLWEGAGKVLGADPEYSQFMQKLADRAPAGADGDESARRQEKALRKEVCVRTLSGERDVVCEKLLMRGIFVLRLGEIEEYVGLGRNAKGHYLQAANEIRAGTRTVQNQSEFDRILDALTTWAGVSRATS